MMLTDKKEDSNRASPVRVLIVDDSAYVRKVMTHMLSQGANIEVAGTARNGLEALEKVATLVPDVVTLDLNMPEMDGIGFVREQMQRNAVPIVLITSANKHTEAVLTALELGAVDFLQKPTALANDKLLSMDQALVEKVKVAAAVPRRCIGISTRAPISQPVSIARALTRRSPFEILVVGVSTGGPQALKELIPQLTADFPLPVAVVMHMPIGYTALYAERLNAIASLTVKEAADGDALRPGTVLLAQAGRHLKLHALNANHIVARLDMQPINTLHRPSVDELFKSAAEVYGSKVLGLVMTGMGSDGQLGAACIKAQGGTVLTEAEESCIVYGMPRSVFEAGLSDAQAPLSDLAKTIGNHL